MNNFSTQHFRINTGEEIICEIMEWEEDNDFILVRNAMAIETNIFDNQERLYMFRPWLLYIESPEEIIFIKKESIVAHTTPNSLLGVQYLEASRDMKNIATQRVKEHKIKEANKLKMLMDQISKIKEEESKEIPDNVIPFPELDDTIH